MMASPAGRHDTFHRVLCRPVCVWRANAVHLTDATITAVSGVALFNAAPVLGPFLAQAGVAPDLGGWGQVASTIVSTGFAVWYAWHVTTKTLPEKDRLHKESIEKLVQEFHTDAKEARDLFKQSLSDIRSAFRCQNQNSGAT